MDLQQFRIEHIKQETHDCKSFYLQPISHPKNITYKAGQFLTLVFEDAIKETRRSYSLGSAPVLNEPLFITVKRKVNGEISRRLLDHYKKGDIINALQPSGRFIIPQPVTSTHFFIVAGSGITPVFSLMKELLFSHSSAKIILLNQCRSEGDIIYKEELHKLHQQFKERFLWIQFFSQPVAHHFRSIRLNNSLLELLVYKYVPYYINGDTDFYICGPVTYMRMAQFTLKLIGIEDAHIHKEQFVVERLPKPAFIVDDHPRKASIRYKQKIHHIDVVYPQTILEAALEKGIELPYSCKGGVCSTCMAKCEHGKVVMSLNEVLSEKDMQQGFVLTCTGYAATDLFLNFDY